MFGRLLPGAIWMDFRAYWGWEPPPAHQNLIFRRRARHACAHAHERAPPVARSKRNGRRHAAAAVRRGQASSPAGKIIIRTNAFVESCHTAARGSGVAVAAVCDARDLMGEVGLAEGVSSVALLVSK